MKEKVKRVGREIFMAGQDRVTLNVTESGDRTRCKQLTMLPSLVTLALARRPSPLRRGHNVREEEVKVLQWKPRKTD